MAPVLSQAGEIQRIRERGMITVSLNRDYPPFSMEKDGTRVGLDRKRTGISGEIDPGLVPEKSIYDRQAGQDRTAP